MRRLGIEMEPRVEAKTEVDALRHTMPLLQLRLTLGEDYRTIGDH